MAAMTRTMAAGLVLWCVAAAGVAQAQSANPAQFLPTTLDTGEEFGGVVTRNVLTSMGQNFHARFSELWETKEGSDKFNITVKERPYARGNTEVLILNSDEVLFRSFLPRDWRSLASLAEQAVDLVYDRVQQLELQRQLFSDPDLSRSGLY